MKVLILHQHFKTPHGGGAIRSYYLAKALIDNGFKVVVITAHDEADKMDNIEGIEVHYLKVPYNNSFGFFKRSVSFLKFVRKAVFKVHALKDVKLCYAISVPLTVGLAAIWIKKRYGIPFVFEVGDLWPDAPIEMGFVKNYFFRNLLYKLEYNTYHAAQSIVALSPAIQSAIQKKIQTKRIDIIPNMADTHFFEKGAKRTELVKKYNVYGKFVVSYIGAMGLANGLDYLIECASFCRKAGLPIQFILCGEGAMKEKLVKTLKQLELENITVLDFVNREGVAEIMDVTDAAFICYRPIPILETGSPNKFFDALAASKLIVVNFGGWIRREIEEYSCGIYVDAHEPSDFIKKIKPFLSDQLLLENYQYKSRSLAENKYSRERLSMKFSEVISAALK